MQFRDDDDMDKQFREAAENYSVSRSGMDFEKVLQQLDKQGTEPPPESPRRRRWLWLLLLLPLFFMGYWLLKEKQSPASQEGGVRDSSAASSGIQSTTPAGGTGFQKDTTTISTHEQPVAGTPGRSGAGTGSPGAATGKQTIQEQAPASGNTTSQTAVTRDRQTGRAKQGTGITAAAGGGFGNSHKGNVNIYPYNGEGVVTETRTPGLNFVPAIALTANTGLYAVPAPQAGALPGKEKLSVADSAVAQPKISPHIRTRKRNGLYLGLIAGPDFSTVKFQQVKNVGYGTGLLIGYRFAGRWSVETGALWDKKYYYTDGEYFDTKKINWTPGAVLLDANGNCLMIEIPLTVHFDFGQGKHSNWYVSAGASSYIMTKESYDYRVKVNNNVYEGAWAYKNKSRNWFSVLHAGIGYEHRAGVLGTLRIEPYIKAPISGIGIGSLPLSSAGLQIGLTRPLSGH